MEVGKKRKRAWKFNLFTADDYEQSVKRTEARKASESTPGSSESLLPEYCHSPSGEESPDTSMNMNSKFRPIRPKNMMTLNNAHTNLHVVNTSSLSSTCTLPLSTTTQQLLTQPLAAEHNAYERESRPRRHSSNKFENIGDYSSTKGQNMICSSTTFSTECLSPLTGIKAPSKNYPSKSKMLRRSHSLSECVTEAVLLTPASYPIATSTATSYPLYLLPQVKGIHPMSPCVGTVAVVQHDTADSGPGQIMDTVSQQNATTQSLSPLPTTFKTGIYDYVPVLNRSYSHDDICNSIVTPTVTAPPPLIPINGLDKGDMSLSKTEQESSHVIVDQKNNYRNRISKVQSCPAIKGNASSKRSSGYKTHHTSQNSHPNAPGALSLNGPFPTMFTDKKMFSPNVSATLKLSPDSNTMAQTFDYSTQEISSPSARVNAELLEVPRHFKNTVFSNPSNTDRNQYNLRESLTETTSRQSRFDMEKAFFDICAICKEQFPTLNLTRFNQSQDKTMLIVYRISYYDRELSGPLPEPVRFVVKKDGHCAIEVFYRPMEEMQFEYSIENTYSALKMLADERYVICPGTKLSTGLVRKWDLIDRCDSFKCLLYHIPKKKPLENGSFSLHSQCDFCAPLEQLCKEDIDKGISKGPDSNAQGFVIKRTERYSIDDDILKNKALHCTVKKLQNKLNTGYNQVNVDERFMCKSDSGSHQLPIPILLNSSEVSCEKWTAVDRINFVKKPQVDVLINNFLEVKENSQCSFQGGEFKSKVLSLPEYRHALQDRQRQGNSDERNIDMNFVDCYSSQINEISVEKISSGCVKMLPVLTEMKNGNIVVDNSGLEFETNDVMYLDKKNMVVKVECPVEIHV